MFIEFDDPLATKSSYPFHQAPEGRPSRIPWRGWRRQSRDHAV